MIVVPQEGTLLWDWLAKSNPHLLGKSIEVDDSKVKMLVDECLVSHPEYDSQTTLQWAQYSAICAQEQENLSKKTSFSKADTRKTRNELREVSRNTATLGKIVGLLVSQSKKELIKRGEQFKEISELNAEAEAWPVRKRLGFIGRHFQKIVITLLVTAVLLLGAIFARGAEPAYDAMPYWEEIVESIELSTLFQMPHDEIFLRFQNDGTTLVTRSSGVVALDCNTNLTCTYSAATNTLTMNAGAGGAVDWDAILNPSAGNQSLAMGTFLTDWVWSGNTSTNTMFDIRDTTGNTGTGHVLSVSTSGTSAAKAIRITDGGLVNGVEMSTAGVLLAIGTGSILADNLTANAIGATTDFDPNICTSSQILERQGAVWACTATPSGGNVDLLDGSQHQDTLVGTVVLGDIVHGNVTPVWARLAGNTTTIRQFLSQTGDGAISAVPVWVQPACSDLSDASATCSTAGATVALDNLASVAINLPLLPDVAAADDFGSATLPFKDLFFAGSSGTPGTNNFRITGASTSGTRVFTVVDAASNSVVPNTGSANNFVTAIAATGVVSIAQPAFTDISGIATAGQVPNLESLNGTLDIASGGTGQTAREAAYDALSPNTTEGDLTFRNATVNTRLPRGANGECLTASTTTILWGSCGGGSGDNITVNGATVTDADFDDTDPAAPSEQINIKWQLNTTPAPDSVSAYVPILAVADGVGAIASDSGLEPAGAGSDTLAILQGCADTEVIKWDNTATDWECQPDADSGGAPTLDAITAAAGSNSINNGDNDQVWNSSLTTAGRSFFTFGESTAAVATGDPVILNITTLAASTAHPLAVTARGTTNGIRVGATDGVLDALGTGGVDWPALLNYPTGCTNEFVRTIADTLTCNPVGTSDISANAADNTIIRDSAGFSVIGKTATGTGNPADVVAADETVFGRTGAGNLVFAALATGQVANQAITFGKMQNIATDRLLGRDTAGSGSPEELTLNATLEFTGAGAIQRAALTGDVTASAGSNATLIAAGVVASAELATANKTFKCNFVLFDDTGLSDSDDIPSVSNCSNPDRAITITEVRCEYTTGTAPIVQLQKDDGSPVNMLSSNLTCGTNVQGACGTGCTTSFVSTEDAIAAEDNLDFLLVTANTSTRLSMLISYTVD